MADMLPKLFFTHFRDTSFVIIEEQNLIAFLIGFVSQSSSQEAYIHFVGVHPAYREKGLAKQLYEQFFAVVKNKGCHTIRCITSPVNKGSIAFHGRMGFVVEEGDVERDGISVHENYDGRGQDRVLFVKRLE